MKKTHFALVGLLLCAAVPSYAQTKATDSIRFNRDIRQVLSDNCFACHGPDSANRKASLRLDTEEGLFKGDYPVVIKGKPGESELLARISAKDKGLMPPVKSHKKLTEAQKDAFRRWIEQGAPWEPHWSFVKPSRPELPAVKNKAWVRNALDQFVLARLELMALSPMAETDRRTLIRRLTLDLIGLPPTPAEVEAFISDKSPDAYEKVVDRLLASKHYGEHRARYWLDAARYADTHGLHVDNYREIWPYRDWVIEAFNRNLPFDQFTIEQLAGDLLPDRTLDQYVATGFHRCNITTNEGGSIQEEVAAMYAKDRVETTATVWLGLTAGCAACHHHKFDPFTMQDFYSFAAFFKNTTQGAMDGNIANTPPIVPVPTGKDRDRWFALQKLVLDLQASKKRRETEERSTFDKWLANPAESELRDPLPGHRFALSVSGKGKNAMVVHEGKSSVLELPAGVMADQGADFSLPGLRFSSTDTFAAPDGAALDAAKPFTFAAWVLPPKEEGSFTVLAKVDGLEKTRQGYLLELNQRVPGFMMTGGGGDFIAVRANPAVKIAAGKWSHLLITYDGKRGAKGLKLYINGKQQGKTQNQGAALKGNIAAKSPLLFGGDGKRGFQGGVLSDVRVYDRIISDDDAELLAQWPTTKQSISNRSKLKPPQREQLYQFYLRRVDAEYGKILDTLKVSETEQAAIRKRSAVTHVMAERPGSMAVAKVLFRGQYDQPKEQVVAATPKALHPFPKDGTRDRLGLARWLMVEDNPLTARVTVNRFWQEIFGTGIVRTSEDFGMMGEVPTHPELLDWLAVEFRENGWDMKKIFKLMVMSAAYRQSAVVSPDAAKKDPLNRFLSRGPRFRMDGETLRDFALSSSGLLVRKIGGPSVKPYQPKGVWEAVAMFGSNTRFYKEDKGEGLYRRSMYTFWKRSAPPAMLDIFNAPSRENCSVRRERTNTPLQALVTMNDVQFVEAARHLAQRSLLEGGKDSDTRLDFLTMHLLSRTFEPRERDICKAALGDFLRHYTEQPKEAAKLIRVGEIAPNAALAAPELAAWTMLANQVMNLDEALNK